MVVVIAASIRVHHPIKPHTGTRMDEIILTRISGQRVVEIGACTSAVHFLLNWNGFFCNHTVCEARTSSARSTLMRVTG